MNESTLWTAGTVSGLTLLGAAAGAVMLQTAWLAPAALPVVFFVAAFVASGFAMQLARRGLDHAAMTGGLAGGLGVFAFFAVPLALGLPDAYLRLSSGGKFILLVVAPALAAATSAAGTLFLSDGVRRYREKHGLIHAPGRARDTPRR